MYFKKCVPTCEYCGLIGLLTQSSWERFSCCSEETWLFALSGSSFCSCVGGRRRVPPFLLQFLNGPCLFSKLLIQPLKPHAKCCLGLALVPAGTRQGLQNEGLSSVLYDRVYFVLSTPPLSYSIHYSKVAEQSLPALAYSSLLLVRLVLTFSCCWRDSICSCRDFSVCVWLCFTRYSSSSRAWTTDDWDPAAASTCCCRCSCSSSSQICCS